jgi:hypothetical protein
MFKKTVAVTALLAGTNVSGQASNDYSPWGGDDELYILANGEGDPMATIMAPGNQTEMFILLTTPLVFCALIPDWVNPNDK